MTHRLNRSLRDLKGSINLRVHRGAHPKISNRLKPIDGIYDRSLVQRAVKGIIILLEVPALSVIRTWIKGDVL